MPTRLRDIVKQWREQNNMTQANLSEKLGKSQSYINKIENGQLFATLDSTGTTIYKRRYLVPREAAFRELAEVMGMNEMELRMAIPPSESSQVFRDDALGASKSAIYSKDDLQRIIFGDDYKLPPVYWDHLVSYALFLRSQHEKERNRPD